VNVVAAWGWMQLGVLLGVLALTTALFSLYGLSALRRRRGAIDRHEIVTGRSPATPFAAIGGVATVISAAAVGILLIILLAVWIAN
jgi:hypothetical protein